MPLPLLLLTRPTTTSATIPLQLLHPDAIYTQLNEVTSGVLPQPQFAKASRRLYITYYTDGRSV
jgi:hypothetical protein